MNRNEAIPFFNNDQSSENKQNKDENFFTINKKNKNMFFDKNIIKPIRGGKKKIENKYLQKF